MLLEQLLTIHPSFHPGQLAFYHQGGQHKRVRTINSRCSCLCGIFSLWKWNIDKIQSTQSRILLFTSIHTQDVSSQVKTSWLAHDWHAEFKACVSVKWRLDYQCFCKYRESKIVLPGVDHRIPKSDGTRTVRNSRGRSVKPSVIFCCSNHPPELVIGVSPLAFVRTYHPGALSLCQVTATLLKIEHP